MLFMLDTLVISVDPVEVVVETVGPAKDDPGRSMCVESITVTPTQR
jgi:hypothetical protein